MYEFSEPACQFAIEALKCGGYNSPTYAKYATEVYQDNETKIMNELYKAYAFHQIKNNWPELTEPYKTLAQSQELQEQNVPVDIAQSVAYRAYFIYYDLTPPSITNKQFKQEELQGFIPNKYLYEFVFDKYKS
ncbi:MAG: hypothetical protein EBU08_11330, partial [Micrococcales bacterium]|nr:hypothetical protein [Micrococcales bacterium]